MKVLIIGIFHNEQPNESNADSTKLRLAKNALKNLLRKAIETRQVGFIGEESKHGVETIAKRLADQHNPRIRWADIDMSAEEEQIAGIPDASVRNAKRRCLDEETMTWTEHRIPEDETRECYFVEKVKKEAKHVESVLVICGQGHVGPLKEKFERMGVEVEVCHHRAP